MASDDDDDYSSDAVPRTSESSQERTLRRMKRKRKRQAASAVEVSALMVFLCGGLIFCLFDVLYISRYIEKGLTPTELKAPTIRIIKRRESRPNHIRTLPTLWNESSIRDLVYDALNSQKERPKASDRRNLPLPSDVAALYGSQPRIWGLDTACDAFQNDPNTDPASRFLTTAGTFNTGTNLMAELLIANCYMPARRAKYKQDGVRWQAVWGKHTPVWNETVRLTHRTYNDR